MTRSFTQVTLAGFARDLEETALANASKLDAARPYGTHLAIWSEVGMHYGLYWDVPVPAPVDGFEPISSIDWIWIIPGREPHHDEPWAWWARPGANEWTVELRKDGP